MSLRYSLTYLSLTYDIFCQHCLFCMVTQSQLLTSQVTQFICQVRNSASITGSTQRVNTLVERFLRTETPASCESVARFFAQLLHAHSIDASELPETTPQLSTLPQELLDEIASFLCVADHVRWSCCSLTYLSKLRQPSSWKTWAWQQEPPVSCVGMAELALGQGLFPVLGAHIQILELHTVPAIPFVHMPHLRSVKYQGVPRKILEQLCRARPKQLETLVLEDLTEDDDEENALRDLSALSGLACSLKRLSLEGAGNLQIGPLSTLTALTELSISDTGLSDLKPLATLTRLRKLSFFASESALDFEPLRPLVHLEYLYCPNVYWTEVSALSHLQRLHFYEPCIRNRDMPTKVPWVLLHQLFASSHSM